MPQQIDFDPSVDYYKALGVSQSASADDIKRAYRKLAKANHPDSTGGDKAKESRFKDISNAYDVLGDSKKRALYDQIRANPGMHQGFPGGFPGGVYSSQSGGPGVFDLGDLFSQFFSGNARAGRVRVDHVDAERGRARNRGRHPGAHQAEDAEYEQKVKASDGTWLKVDRNDVSSDIRISFDRAILGTVATVATIDGKAEVKIPPGTSSGKRLRLRGKGMPDRAGGAGDHYVTVQIDVPHDLDDEAKKALIQFVTRLRKRGHND
ncbi:MAG TPA: DnaJ domain-containing protein [Kofleriaceae bacterium]|jgi:DnaJ-class molecular chaperone|nr:DnaJ domain-containing protein [Kofleriaceae bacterium]